MINLDKIKNGISEQIINTIDLAANKGDTALLEVWIQDCKSEIEIYEEQKLNSYKLKLELAYLEMVLV